MHQRILTSRNIEEDPSKNPRHEPRIAPDNNNNTITSSQYVPHVQESPVSKGSTVSEVLEHTASKGGLKASNLNKFHLAQQLSNAPSGVPSCEGNNESKISKIHDLNMTRCRSGHVVETT